MSEIAVEVQNISKRYELGLIGGSTLMETLGNKMRKGNRNSFKEKKEFWALKDISFEVKRGEVMGIIGRNGAGKSTLLKVISRITQPTNGHIKVNGRVASLLEVGTGFHPELTGKENIYLNGSILGMTRKEIKSKFDEIVEFSGVSKFLETPVKRYSSGMFVRLAFAVAAHLEPEILVIDEVLAVGDYEFQKKCLGKMKEVSEGKGRTVLFVSHNMASVQSLCTEAIVVNEGKINYRGDVTKAIEHYLITNKTTGKKALKSRTQIDGNGDLTFVDLKLIQEEENSTALNGQPIYLQFTLESQIEISGKLDIGTKIYNNQGLVIFSCSTRYIHLDNYVNLKKGDQVTVECIIPQLELIKGKYFLSGYASIDGIKCDYLENIGEFFVENGDFYKTGKTPKIGKGLVLVDHNWRIL